MTTPELFSYYYWATFIITAVCCLRIPSKMPPSDNLAGSIIVAMFGLILWPFAVAALIRHLRRG